MLILGASLPVHHDLLKPCVSSIMGASQSKLTWCFEETVVILFHFGSVFSASSLSPFSLHVYHPLLPLHHIEP
jgi:hypothetical protein